ncbi:hypothetical protein CDAR_313251 [Caerostris darwini]|uniref:Uncharacterized protein n=1 Tax=Caerostris darwini TaxID=1538125 RepID=A0AAV4QM06_9ARAC|nr:hypothetical protein CDAR_313251 [Caerostris darwini]
MGEMGEVPRDCILLSHTGFYGDEITNLLAKEGTFDKLILNDSLTYFEFCFKIKTSNQRYGKLLRLTPGIIGMLQVVPFELVEPSRPPIVFLQVDALSASLLIRGKQTFPHVLTITQSKPLPNTC